MLSPDSDQKTAYNDQNVDSGGSGGNDGQESNTNTSNGNVGQVTGQDLVDLGDVNAANNNNVGANAPIASPGSDQSTSGNDQKVDSDGSVSTPGSGGGGSGGTPAGGSGGCSCDGPDNDSGKQKANSGNGNGSEGADPGNSAPQNKGGDEIDQPAAQTKEALLPILAATTCRRTAPTRRAKRRRNSRGAKEFLWRERN